MESGSDSSFESRVERQKGRKRLRYIQLWKKRRQKARKDSGKAYKTYKGEQQDKKRMADILFCRCNLHCSSNVARSERERIFREFYQLGNHDSQNKYLYGLIERTMPKRKVPSAKTSRVNSFVYRLRLSNGNHVQICKQTFCQVHGIGKRRVENLCTAMTSGVLSCSDGRGKHANRPHALSESLKEQVRQHISSFPSRESHYSRQSNKNRKYLPEGLSIARMYRLYLEKYEPDICDGEKPQVKEWLYRKIFTEEFNIGFGYPRSDTCETCDLLKVAIDSAEHEEECTKLQTELATHHENAAKGYESLRSDSKNDENTLVLSFDLQQNLPVPTLVHGSMFYLRQLWVYNFGIHECYSGSATMCLWNECIAGRGSDEIVSCLLEYFSQARPSIKKLICYSDSCSGQNKNSLMICVWTWLIFRGLFTRIDHTFLVRGHTYLPCDRDFAQIEKKKGSEMIYLPNDWEKLIKGARITKPFQIQRMEKEKFFDYALLIKQFTLRKKDTLGKPVLFSTASWLNFGEGEDGGKVVSHPGQYWMKRTFSLQEPWQKICILKGRKKLPPPIDMEFPVKYPDGHPLNPKKVNDLQSMIPYLPPASREYYASLKDHVVSTESNDD